MAGFEDMLKGSVFGNGQAMQLAGLAVMQGEDVGSAISKAVTQSAQMEQQQMVKEQYQQQQRVQQMLPQLMQEIDPADMRGSFVKMAGKIGLREAGVIFDQFTSLDKEARLQQQQAMWNGGNTGQGGIDLQSMSDADLIKMSINEAFAKPVELEMKRRERVAGGAKDDTNKNRDLEYKISTDYDTASKNFIGIRDGFTNLRTAAQQNTPEGDIQLIYAVMKTQDPTSTVREAEFDTAQKTLGIPEWLQVKLESLKSGDRLNPRQREAYLKLGQQNYDNAYKQQSKLMQGYRGRASRFNLNPNNVIIDHSIVDDAPSPVAKDAPQQGARPAQWNDINDPGVPVIPVAQGPIETNVMPNIIKQTPIPEQAAPVQIAPPTADELAEYKRLRGVK